MTLDAGKLLRHFLSGKAELTVLAYRKDLDDLRQYLKVPTIEAAAIRLLGGTHPSGQGLLAGYKATMQNRRGLGAATINRRLSTLRSLGKEARVLGMVPWVLEARGVRAELVRDTRGPGVDAVGRLLRHLEALPRTAPALRDRAIIRLLTDLALRRGAICKLNANDFVPAQRELRVLEKGKRSKAPRRLTADATIALSAWVKVRRGSASGPLFINFDQVHRTKTGQRLTGSAIYAILKARASAAGLKGPIRPHGVRHTAITMAAEFGAQQGYGLDKIREFSGHANTRTLERYLDRTRDVQGELAEGVSARLRTGRLFAAGNAANKAVIHRT